MENIEFIEKRQSEIDKLIKSSFKDPTLDGIINPKEYINSPIKILWILKEINDIVGYNQRDALNNLAQKVLVTNSLKNCQRKGWWPTIDPVIYISYQILNNFLKWSDPKLRYIQDDPSMVGILQKLAYINIKKECGGSTSNYIDLLKGYLASKEIISQQINLIKPDVVICGNTINFLMHDYGIESLEKYGDYNLNYHICTNRMYIGSYHPQYLSRKNENFKGAYFDTIVNLVENWYRNTRNQHNEN